MTASRRSELIEGAPTPARLLAESRRIVVKVGSSLLIDPAGEGVRTDWLAGLAGRVDEQGRAHLDDDAPRFREQVGDSHFAAARREIVARIA